MIFNIPKTVPRITKAFLLSKNTEETYMSTYLGVPIKKGLQKSSLRVDNRPTATFYRNKRGELIYHDFGIGFDGNFINVVMFLYKCSFSEAVTKIAKDFNYIPNDDPEPIKIRHSNVIIEEKTETNIQIEEQPFTQLELKWWESFGIHKETLDKYKIYSCKSIFLNNFYFSSSSPRNPIYGYYGGKKQGIELWRIYFPLKKEYRFLSNWPKTMIQGAKQLPNGISNIIITKSMKDCMNLYECGINAIAPCSETVLMNQKQMDKIRMQTDKLIYLGDNDLPGVRGAHHYKKQYPFIRCIFIKRKYAKDISDLYKFVGKQDHKEAIEELKEIFNNETIRETKHFWIF